MNYSDAVLLAACGGLLYNRWSKGLNGKELIGFGFLPGFGKDYTNFDYGGIMVVNNLFGQFQLPPPFSY